MLSQRLPLPSAAAALVGGWLQRSFNTKNQWSVQEGSASNSVKLVISLVNCFRRILIEVINFTSIGRTRRYCGIFCV